MKRLFTAAALLAASASLFAAVPDWINLERYAAANDSIANAAADPQRIVLMGNSITDMWPRKRAAFFSGNHLVGRGISGQTSYQMLSRFRDDVVALAPRAVVINSGTNDVARNTHPYNRERTLGNIKSMTEIALANGIAVYLSSVLPAVSFPWNPGLQDVAEEIKELNRSIRAYADEKGLPYIDYYSAMVADDGKGMRAGLSTDGVHPNEEGYAIMEQVLLKALATGSGE